MEHHVTGGRRTVALRCRFGHCASSHVPSPSPPVPSPASQEQQQSLYYMTRLHQPFITHIKEVLQQERGVVAAWLEGSIARHEDDDVADIDLWIAVGERSFNTFIESREQWLSQCGTVVSVLYPKDLENTEEDLDTMHVLFEELPPTVGVDITVI